VLAVVRTLVAERRCEAAGDCEGVELGAGV